MNPHLAFLLTSVYDRSTMHPPHLLDLRNSGITDETIRVQKIRDVMPPAIFDQLLDFRVPAAITSMYLLPFFSSAGQVIDHVRVKVFPPLKTDKGTIKYLQPKRSGVRIYLPLATLDKALHSDEPLWIVEGEKKSLAVAQQGYPAVGICGIDGWHVAGSRDLHPDLDDVGLRGRVVKIVPDSDVKTSPAVAAAVRRLGGALMARGATALIVRVPDGFKGIDDWLTAETR
jgi:hypothetical protein